MKTSLVYFCAARLLMLFAGYLNGEACAVDNSPAEESSAVNKPAINNPSVKPWGFYQIHWNDVQFAQQLAEEMRILGGSPAYVLDFRDLNPHRGFPRGVADIAQQRGLEPVISMELCDWSRHGWKGGLAAIANGDFDIFFQQWASDAAKFSHPVIFRFGFEMNGDWFSWGRQPILFRQAWQRIHAIFIKQSATNVRWMFAPNILYGDLTPTTGIDAYYPGDELVDVLGMDGYNFGDDHDQWHHWQKYTEVFEVTVAALSAHHKPLIISEIGCANDDARKPEWVADFLHEVGIDQRIHGFIWFDLDKSHENEPNWRLDSDAQSLKIFRQWAGASSVDVP